MSRGWRVIAGWGGWLCVLAAIQIIFTPSAIELSLIAGAGAGMVLVGVAALMAERRGAPPRPEGGAPFALPHTSAASVAVALGLAVFVLGWAVGTWLMGIGAGIFTIGVGGLVRERRAQRL